MIDLVLLQQEYPDIWLYTGEDPAAFLDMLVQQGIVTAEEVDEWKATPWAPEWPEPALSPEEAEIRMGISAALFDKQKAWYELTFREVLKAFWAWMIENVTELVDKIWGHLKATFEQYWPPVQDKLEDAGRWIYDLTNKALLSVGEVTPEKASAMALKMFGVALGAGITAHALSVGFEMIHPFKSLGFHQMTGMIAQLGSFGPVSAATLGQVHYAALRQPMSYAVNKVTRSKLPDEMTLQILAVKPDIPMELFTKTMQYHGYSDFWIDRIKATMFHEPRYFELKMMSEDETAMAPPAEASELARAEFARYNVKPSDQWLFMKARRVGYSPEDSKIFVASIIKGGTRDQRKEYYKQGFNLFKEGYIQREHFNKIIDDLELRPEAVTLSTRAAELAYLFDTISDEVRYWTDSYLKDLISDDELELQLSLLGLNRWRVDLAVRRAKVRKYKKPGKPVPTEQEKAMNQVRSRYSQAYVTLYRKELIDIDTLYAYLLELGIVEELVEATCTLELSRKEPEVLEEYLWRLHR